MKIFRPNEIGMQERLLMTVAYFDIFEVPVKITDLKRIILGKSNYEDKEILNMVNELEGLEENDGFIFLKGRADILTKHEDAKNYSQVLLNRAKRKSKIFKYIPFLKFVAVCNYLPLGIAEESSDIDLFIISENQKIFTVRMFMTLITHFFGMRRHSDKIKGRFCLSFYLDEGNMDLEDLLIAPYDLYFAYWQIALLPLYGDIEFFDKIQSKNLWVRNYFDNIKDRYEVVKNLNNKKSAFTKMLERILSGKMGDLLEWKLAKYFVARHEKVKLNLPPNASVEVSARRLKFHNNDKRHYFRREFERRLDNLGVFY